MGLASNIVLLKSTVNVLGGARSDPTSLVV
jgi:hypothetical protein